MTNHSEEWLADQQHDEEDCRFLRVSARKAPSWVEAKCSVDSDEDVDERNQA